MNVTHMNGMGTMVKCPNCNGAGKQPYPCVTCNNKGSVTEYQAIEFEVNKGSDHGHRR